MGNKITEKYFEHANFADNEKRVLEEITTKINFQPEKEIFRGQIYDKDKVGSLIYKGVWQDNPTVLKIQGLQPDVDEIDMISRFNDQNESAKIRLPKLYDGSKWNEKDGYGFLLLEYVDAPQIYQPPFAKQEQIKDFCALYQEYRAKCLRDPFIEREPNEQSSLVFTAQRVSHWAKIAQIKGRLDETEVKNVEKFLSLAGKHLPSIKMEFMHGHFTYDDIFKLSDKEYVLMSNLFWSYRPEFYDTTFHLWAGIKSLRDQNITVEQIIEYLQNWLEEYKKLPVVIQDADFERKFNMMMAERCVGALLVDIQNQHYDSDRSNFIAHLTELFRDLFKHFADKLEKTKIE
ncbi:MAG: hypothetical protein U9O55_01955 [Patescibacteria group bacterium]|nr:hypothetical protein [Patescibacteria group bacterium]